MELFRKISGIVLGENRNFTSAIILAGGSSLRFGGNKTKQMTELKGMPMIVHTLLSFQHCKDISEIIVAAKEDEIPEYDRIKDIFGISKLKKAVVGGDTRQRSAVHALMEVSDKAAYIAIHDGARCLVTPYMITSVLTVAKACGGAIAAAKCKDTVKEVTGAELIEKTHDREALRLAQTPQIFRSDIYRAALYSAEKDGFSGTDDASLCEHYGFEVRCVDCTDENIKITTKTDLLFAEAILKKREEEKCSE